MDVLAGHPLPEALGRHDPTRSHLVDEILLNDLEIPELLIEMTGEQQHGIFQFALAVAQRPLTEIPGHHGRADCDRCDQQQAAQDQPTDRTAAHERFDVSGSCTVGRHGARIIAGANAEITRSSPAMTIANVPKWKSR